MTARKVAGKAPGRAPRKAAPAEPKMLAAMNRQIVEELDSAYLYLAMAAYFEGEGLEGMAHWMKAQSIEEVIHAMKFFGHIHSRAGTVELQALAKPQKTWASPLAAFEAAYAHERHITRCIHDLVDLAAAERDHAALPLLQWFVEEQVEEEESALKVVDLLKRVGSSGHGLLLIDRQLAARAMPVSMPANGE
ncbi:MAG: ferritin [Candidatus Eisenbacteria bacterium]|uniref:Ferritin n=1 Tax=Eiseniibacteriota bacterium TaxID=2212470 RepID=A0A938BNH4_UNCEI|nr:ferritin [Candidatus Eisenbacteria bacterium]